MKKWIVVFLCIGLALAPTLAQDSVKTTKTEKAPGKVLPQAVIAKAYSESYRQEAVGKYVEAIRALGEVFEAYPKTYTVNYRMGWLYYLNRNYADAMASLGRALIVVPT